MMEDADLLRRFTLAGDQDAFRELVQRHVSFVYSSALRQLNGDAHLAADVAQTVFTDLARKARSLTGHPVLAGWLFTSTRFAAAKLVRAERRRRAREQEAQLMQELSNDDAAALDWSRVRLVLDAALADLKPAEREAILLRYFEQRDYRAIGAQLSVTDNTARMRVDRALDTLRAALERRGVTSTTVALAAALTSEAVVAAPAGLGTTVASAALAGTGSLSLWAAFMSMTKLHVGIAAGLAVAGASGYVMETRANAALLQDVSSLQRETAALADARAANRELTRTAGEVASLRTETATFDRLSAETVELQSRLKTVQRAQKSAEAAAASRLAANYDVAELDRLPKVVTTAPPQYPFELRRAGVEGSVTVDFVVDSSGNVQNAHAVKSSRPEFEAAAVEAIRAWKFDPGQKGGRAVNTHMQVPIVFNTGNGSSAGQPQPYPASAPKT